MMNKFLIGQYGAFHEEKYRRDYVEGFYGIEACLFQDERDIARLAEESCKTGFRVGIHFPLRAGIYPIRDALFLSTDDAVRSHAYEVIEQELAFAAPLHPSYILFHYPKPVILDDRVDWRHWRFADRREYAFESTYSQSDFKEKNDALFAWLSDKARQYRFTPVLEFDALNRYVYEDDDLLRLLNKYPRIKVCLDTARLYLQDRLDPNFDARAILRQYAEFAELVHLSNVQLGADNTTLQSRHPVLPRLDPRDGWAPIEDYMRIIRERNPDVKILFEHRSELVSDEELTECYRWVEQLTL